MAATATGAAKSSAMSEASKISSEATAVASSVESKATSAASAATSTTSTGGAMRTEAPVFAAVVLGAAMYIL